VGELPDRLTWDEWIDWQAWYQLQPWGEERADLRASVGIAYALAPYMPPGAELPALQWPYYEGEAEIDIESLAAAAEAERLRWEEWEATRPRIRHRDPVVDL
jgi:hypothetical protein